MSRVFMVFLLLFFVSCEDTEPIMDAEQNMLWGNGAKAWIIQKQIVDGSEIQLDTNQIKYTKIYSSDQTYYDSDGLSGQYTYDASESKLIENIRTGGSNEQLYTKYYVEEDGIEDQFYAANSGLIENRTSVDKDVDYTKTRNYYYQKTQ